GRREAFVALLQAEVGGMVAFGRRVRLTLGARWLPGGAFYGKIEGYEIAREGVLAAVRADVAVGSDRLMGGVSLLSARSRPDAPHQLRLLGGQLFLAMGW